MLITTDLAVEELKEVGSRFWGPCTDLPLASGKN